MSRLGFVVLLGACGRFGFDPGGPSGSGGDAGDGTGSIVDGFVRGDVTFTHNIAFMTDAVVTPGSLATVTAADAACQSAAEAAGLAGEYVAWLSTSTSNAIDRLTGSRGWVRADGLPFVDQPSDLATQRKFSPLIVTANGVPTSATAVVTGTKPDGTVSTATCDDLMSTAGLLDHGLSTAINAEWTWIGYSWSMCDQLQRVYCFGIGDTRPLVIEPVAARTAFLSRTKWGPGNGIADADAVCRTDAAAAGLPNASTFLALLATAGASPASRFTDGLPWKRVDGMLIAPTAQALFAEEIQVPLNVDAMGMHSTDTGSSAVAWLGAPSINAIGVDTCQDWSASNQGNTGTTLNYVRVDPGTSSYGCGTPNLLFCLEP